MNPVLVFLAMVMLVIGAPLWFVGILLVAAWFDTAEGDMR